MACLWKWWMLPGKLPWCVHQRHRAKLFLFGVLIEDLWGRLLPGFDGPTLDSSLPLCLLMALSECFQDLHWSSFLPSVWLRGFPEPDCLPLSCQSWRVLSAISHPAHQSTSRLQTPHSVSVCCFLYLDTYTNVSRHISYARAWLWGAPVEAQWLYAF